MWSLLKFFMCFRLLSADLATATLLISFGAVIGKTTPLQLIIMGLIETAIFTANEHLGLSVLKVSKLVLYFQIITNKL
jgi:ammonium transporter Rh